MAGRVESNGSHRLSRKAEPAAHALAALGSEVQRTAMPSGQHEQLENSSAVASLGCGGRCPNF
jgi:hypothetical protein